MLHRPTVSGLWPGCRGGFHHVRGRVRLAGTPAVLATPTAESPRLASRLITYRTPDFAQPATAAMLLDVLPAERDATVSPPAREASARVVRLAPDLAAGLGRGNGFANGRSACGLLEQAIGAQALRLAGPEADLDGLADEELTLLTVADLPRQLP